MSISPARIKPDAVPVHKMPLRQKDFDRHFSLPRKSYSQPDVILVETKKSVQPRAIRILVEVANASMGWKLPDYCLPNRGHDCRLGQLQPKNPG